VCVCVGKWNRGRQHHSTRANTDQAQWNSNNNNNRSAVQKSDSLSLSLSLSLSPPPSKVERRNVLVLQLYVFLFCVVSIIMETSFDYWDQHFFDRNVNLVGTFGRSNLKILSSRESVKKSKNSERNVIIFTKKQFFRKWILFF